MISVILPILVWSDYTIQTLNSLYNNSTGYFDQLVIFIDGLASADTVHAIRDFYDNYQHKDISILVLRATTRAGVNEARMHSMRVAKNRKLFIVNDDILVSNWWDKHLDTLLETNWVVCPMFTLGDKEFAWKPQKKSDNIAWHAWWLDFSHRGQIWDIPKALKIWYWDDRVWRRCIDLWHQCYWTDSVIVHHYVSKTVFNAEVTKKVMEVVESDKAARIKIIKQMGRCDTRYSHL